MRTLNIFLSGVLCALLLLGAGSCMMGPKYESPRMELPTSLNADTSTDSVLMADMTWWEFYGDSTLRELIDRTLYKNRDMVAAAARVREFAALRRINLSGMLPELGVNAGTEREMEDYKKGERDFSTTVEGKLTFGWEIDLWGNLRWSDRRAVAEYLSTVEARRALQMTLVSQVATAYFELMSLDSELSIVRQTLVTREEGVKQARLRFEGGLTSETSYQQAQVEMATTATLIPELIRQIQVKENEIMLLAGEFPGPVERGSLAGAIVLPEQLPLGLPSELLRRRPDVRRAEKDLVAAHAAVGVAYTDRFPRLRLTGTYGFENGEISGLLGSPHGIIEGAIVGPLFNFGSKRAAHRASQARYEQATAEYENTVLTVFKEVNDALVGYNSARESNRLRRELEAAAGKYVDLARLQYINGVINYLDVLDAQRKHFDARIGVINASRDECIALVELYKALGGGWSASDDYDLAPE